jgi:hypothetical protein
VTATDLLKQTEDSEATRSDRRDDSSNTFKVSGDQQEDEWIEPVGEQEFVIEGAGIKRLELEQETPVDEKENQSDEERGGDGDNERGETSWKNTENPNQTETNNQQGQGQMPGQMPGAQRQQSQTEKENNEDNKNQPETQKSKYVPPSQRKQQQTAIKVNEGPYKRREKLNIESAADFPTLGAAADTTPEGFEQVSQKSAGKSWGAGSTMTSASTGVSNRFQGLENH